LSLPSHASKAIDDDFRSQAICNRVAEKIINFKIILINVQWPMLLSQKATISK
jgi:hypothetical protein